MRARPWIVGALGTGLALVSARLVARYVLHDSVIRRTSSKPCGALDWVTTGITRKAPFEETAHVETTSVVLVEGKATEEDVLEVRCRYLDGIAAVVTRSAPDEVHIRDTRSGELERTLRFGGAIRSTAWSPDGQWVASRTGTGSVRLEVLSATGEGSPRVVTADPRVVSGFGWSEHSKLCWVLVAAAAGARRTADLECRSPVADAATHVAHSELDDDGSTPWVGFVGEAAHLCGLGVRPRDLECRGLRRPDED